MKKKDNDPTYWAWILVFGGILFIIGFHFKILFLKLLGLALIGCIISIPILMLLYLLFVFLFCLCVGKNKRLWSWVPDEFGIFFALAISYYSLFYMDLFLLKIYYASIISVIVYNLALLLLILLHYENIKILLKNIVFLSIFNIPIIAPVIIRAIK